MALVDGFYEDLAYGQEAEHIVQTVFSRLNPNYTFENVGEIKEYWHKGDIKATAPDGREIFIEVKRDGRIATTQNVLCEYANYYHESKQFKNGNMSSTGDIYAIVSDYERRIYVIDYKYLRENYKKGRHKIIPHPQQDTYCHLLPLRVVQEDGGLIGVVNY